MGSIVSVFGWFSNCDDYAGVRGVTKNDRKAMRFDQSVPEPDEVVRLEPVRDANERMGDFPNTGLAYPKCVSKRAFSALQALLEPTGLLRRADLEGLEYWLYWPDTVVDCLNYTASEILKMPSGYEQLITPVFHDSVGEAGPVFLVPQFRTQVLFVTEVFLETARDAGLKGLELRQGGGAGAVVTRVG